MDPDDDHPLARPQALLPAPASPDPSRHRFLLLSQTPTAFTARLLHALETGGQAEWRLASCTSAEQALDAAQAFTPDALILDDATLPWAQDPLLRDSGLPFLAIDHAADQGATDLSTPTSFDALLCPDPTLLPHNPRIHPVLRPLPTPRRDPAPAPPTFTVGCFGDETHTDGFVRLCRLIDTQFNTALIRLALAPGCAPALRSIIEQTCREAFHNPGIALEIIQTPIDDAALLDFLAANTINAFLDEDLSAQSRPPICPRIDLALACGRPFAVSPASRFRHVHAINPSIRADERTLADIAGSGIVPLRPLIARSAPAQAGAAWEAAIHTALQRRHAVMPGGRPYNGPLRSGLDLAFVIDAVPRLLQNVNFPRLLALIPDEPAIAALQDRGWRIQTPSPPTPDNAAGLAHLPPASFDLILALDATAPFLSDDAYLRHLADLLAPGAAAILTLDLHPDDLTIPTLRQRLLRAAPDCALIDPDRWDTALPDGRISCVLRRFPLPTLRLAAPLLASPFLTALRTAPPGPLPPFEALRQHGTVHTRMHTQIGTETREAGLRLFAADGDRPGFLVFGPYIPLPAGDYECSFAIRLPENPPPTPDDTPLLTIDTARERIEYPPIRRILRADLTPGRFTLITARFTLAANVEAAEIRLHLDQPVPLAAAAAVAVRGLAPS